MRLLVSLFVASGLWAQNVLLLSDEPGSWPAILGSVGISLKQASDVPIAMARQQIELGSFGILEGASATAEAFGITPTDETGRGPQRDRRPISEAWDRLGKVARAARLSTTRRCAGLCPRAMVGGAPDGGYPKRKGRGSVGRDEARSARL